MILILLVFLHPVKLASAVNDARFQRRPSTINVSPLLYFFSLY